MILLLLVIPMVHCCRDVFNVQVCSNTLHLLPSMPSRCCPSRTNRKDHSRAKSSSSEARNCLPQPPQSAIRYSAELSVHIYSFLCEIIRYSTRYGPRIVRRVVALSLVGLHLSARDKFRPA